MKCIICNKNADYLLEGDSLCKTHLLEAFDKSLKKKLEEGDK